MSFKEKVTYPVVLVKIVGRKPPIRLYDISEIVHHSGWVQFQDSSVVVARFDENEIVGWWEEQTEPEEVKEEPKRNRKVEISYWDLSNLGYCLMKELHEKGYFGYISAPGKGIQDNATECLEKAIEKYNNFIDRRTI